MASSFCTDTWFVSEVSLLEELTRSVVHSSESKHSVFITFWNIEKWLLQRGFSHRLDQGQFGWFCSQISLIFLRIFCMISELKLPTLLKHQLMRKSVHNCWLLYNFRLDVLSIIVFSKYESAKECTKWSPAIHFLGFFFTVALLSCLGNADVTHYQNAFDVTFENTVFKNKAKPTDLGFREDKKPTPASWNFPYPFIQCCIIP